MGVPKAGETGVRYNAPPIEILPDVVGQITRAVESIGPADLAMVAVADRKGGWNSAVVTRSPEGKWGQVSGIIWIGKAWGTDKKLDFGVKVMWTKKF